MSHTFHWSPGQQIKPQISLMFILWDSPGVSVSPHRRGWEWSQCGPLHDHKTVHCTGRSPPASCCLSGSIHCPGSVCHYLRRTDNKQVSFILFEMFEEFLSFVLTSRTWCEYTHVNEQRWESVSDTYCLRAGGWWDWAWCPLTLWSTRTSCFLHSGLESSQQRQETAPHHFPPGETQQVRGVKHHFTQYPLNTADKNNIKLIVSGRRPKRKQ